MEKEDSPVQVATRQGERPYMEDMNVFKAGMADIPDPAAYIKSIFTGSDDTYKGNAGSTATMAIAQGGKLTTGSAGDSPAFLFVYDPATKGIEAVKLAEEHNTGNEAEVEALKARGGKVGKDKNGTLRVIDKNGQASLMVTRGIGDGKHYDGVTAEPEIKQIDLAEYTANGKRAFLLVGSDGLGTDEAAGLEAYKKSIARAIQEGNENGLAEKLASSSSAKGTGDNITAMFAELKADSNLAMAVYDGHGGDSAARHAAEITRSAFDGASLPAQPSAANDHDPVISHEITGATGTEAPFKLFDPASDAPPPAHANTDKTKLHEVLKELWDYKWLDGNAFASLIKHADPDTAVKTGSGFDISLLNGRKVSWNAKAEATSKEQFSSPSEDFDQSTAEAMTALARLRGWKSLDVDGPLENKEKIWLSVQRQNLEDRLAFEAGVKNGTIPAADKEGKPTQYVDMFLKDFTPAPDSQVVRQWQQEEAMRNGGISLRPSQQDNGELASAPAAGVVQKKQEDEMKPVSNEPADLEFSSNRNPRRILPPHEGPVPVYPPAAAPSKLDKLRNMLSNVFSDKSFDNRLAEQREAEKMMRQLKEKLGNKPSIDRTPTRFDLPNN